MNEVYLVWEMIPEATQIYHLVQLSDELFEKIKGCHGHFVNLDATPESITNDLSWLNKYLVGKAASIIYPNTIPIEIHDGTLVVCGWIL